MPVRAPGPLRAYPSDDRGAGRSRPVMKLMQDAVLRCREGNAGAASRAPLSGTGSRRNGHEARAGSTSRARTRSYTMGDIPRPLLTNRFTEAIDFALVARRCARARTSRTCRTF